MLMGGVLLCLFVVSALYALATGIAAAAGSSVMEGAQAAISFCISIIGGLCLWSAMMELMERSGLSAAMGRILRPILRRLFPRSTEETDILEALSENISANLLGLGNAATPAGIRAARGMARLGESATDELCLLVVLNTASIQLLPTTIASVRASYGASSAFDILPAVWLSSLLSVTAGLSVARLFKRLWR